MGNLLKALQMIELWYKYVSHEAVEASLVIPH